MRLIMVLVLVSVAGVIFVSTNRTNSRRPLPAADTTITLKIDGMVCVACAGQIEKLVRGVDGVRSATVKLETGEARIEYDSTRTASEALAARISGAGFKAALVNSHRTDLRNE